VIKMTNTSDWLKCPSCGFLSTPESLCPACGASGEPWVIYPTYVPAGKLLDMVQYFYNVAVKKYGSLTLFG
jgi:ribosomal protein L32